MPILISVSLYSMKPILKSSEVDDSRPTAIRVLSEESGLYQRAVQERSIP
ncbi:MAG: hypothetical protein V8S42_01560 [Lachnospiraceae bacterium]